MQNALLLISGLAVFALKASAQQFEVAVVKPAVASAECSSRVNGAELTFTNCTLQFAISWAWNSEPWQRVVNNGPAWVLSGRFSIRAKASRSLDRKNIGAMLGKLLEDRFGLVWHKEKKEAPVFILSTAKSRPAIKPTPAGACVPFDHAAPPGPPVSGGCGLRVRYTEDGEGILMDGSGVRMADMIRSLSFTLGREIVDRTGLTGEYNISVHFARDSSLAHTGPPVLPPPKEFSAKFPSLFTAMRKFGLELKTGKAPVDVFVIDNAHKPSEN